MNIASIDIGTNTVILLIAEIRDNKIIPLRNEYRIPRIGKGVLPGQPISNEKESELIRILKDYKRYIDQYSCKSALAIGTNALRIASNAPEIIYKVREKTGIAIRIISGDDEAEYSFLGAVTGYDDEMETLVIDIGGGSTELIFGRPGEIQYKHSFHTGAVMGTEKFFFHSPPLSSEIISFNNFLSATFIDIGFESPGRSIAIAGTPTTLACMQKGLTIYHEDDVEGSVLKQADVNKLMEELRQLSSDEIRGKYHAVVEGREDVLLAGTIILYKLMMLLGIKEVSVSTKGIRYGVMEEYIRRKKTQE
jgi:exopolyphosphatase/guanosine-5'-triphosphate,3'-diphosphate pyrophosphatase